MKAFFSSIFLFILAAFSFQASLQSEQEMILLDNLKQAKAGDFIVTAQNKTYTLLLVRQKTDRVLCFEEITVPAAKLPKHFLSWRSWAEGGAPGHTSWILYTVNLLNGATEQAFSFTKNKWFTTPQGQNFLSTMLNLPLKSIPEKERRKIGARSSSDAPDRRSSWQPRLIVDGHVIPGVHFTAWQTHWPKDGSELANKSIEIYIPQESYKYPSYFPYWLQVSGWAGKAKIRIVDSGSQLISPQRDIPLNKIKKSLK
jgi:hypothetical protein